VARVFPEWTVLIGAYIGAAIGSFLNVVIYRLPRGLSLNEPRFSFCPACRHRLTALDLAPLVSWLALRGKCRHCGAPIAPRYFIVELCTALTWGTVWWQYLIVGWDPVRAVCLAVFAAILIAALFIDLAYYIIPDQLNALLLLLGFAYNAVLISMGSPAAYTNGWPSSVLGALVGFAVFWFIAFVGRLAFGRDAMGHGDIKMARGIGAVLFPATALLGFAVAVVCGAVLGLLQVAFRGRGAHNEVGDDQALGEEEPPESVASLLQSGLGYLLCLDVIGLVFPKVYEAWFRENPYAVEDVDEEAPVGPTMIPFGPYLAIGAIVAALFERPLLALAQRYWQWATGGPSI
jgi:leader peptidase (prepilin peptidase)/N-methyltransferase